MKAIQFGCGGNIFPAPWENYDLDVDITKPLPFEDECTDLVYCSHTFEHVSPPDGFRFLKECLRILKPGGVLRLSVPSIEQVHAYKSEEYAAWVKEAGFGDGTQRGAIEHLITNHGHLACWSTGTLMAAMFAAGFHEVIDCPVGLSGHLDLCGLEWHGRVIGENNNRIESICVEGIKA